MSKCKNLIEYKKRDHIKNGSTLKKIMWLKKNPNKQNGIESTHSTILEKVQPLFGHQNAIWKSIVCSAIEHGLKVEKRRRDNCLKKKSPNTAAKTFIWFEVF